MNVSKKVASILAPLTNINPSMYRCQSESDMLEVLFMIKSDEILKTETIPLLSETFRKNGSISSEQCSQSAEIDNKGADDHKIIQENAVIENNIKINNSAIENFNTDVDKSDEESKNK